MLYVIEGPAGSGKTTRAYELLLGGAREHKDRNYILVIPEQSSITAQKDIIDMSPVKGILNIDILSFNRLAHRIFESAGGEAADLIDDSGKNLIIRHIADDIKGELSVLGGELKKSGYVAEIRSVISEFMQYGIDPEDIPGIADRAAAGSPYLSRKLKDVGLIYSRFREYMGERFMTREELLIRAAKEVGGADFLKDATLIFDSFTGFTPVQYTFIEALLSGCKDIYICVTDSENKRGSLFALGEETRERLGRIGEHFGLEEISLREDLRHRAGSDIALLGKHIFDLNPSGTNASDDGSVVFASSKEPYSEVRDVMREISHLVRDRGWHYRDCGILMGDTELYADIVLSEAEIYHIPVYVDRTRHISLNPFTELIRAAILVLKENYSYTSVFHLLRSYLTDVETDDIDLAENYVLALGIRGRSAYAKPFTKAYRGVSEEMIDAAERVRQALNDILRPLTDLMSGRDCATVSALTGAVRQICADLKSDEKLEQYVNAFEGGADPERAMEYAQIHDILFGQFDNMDSLIGGQEVSIQEFSELYEDALSEIRVGVIPPKSDVVMAGDLTRSRFSHIRALFFIGMVEGVIPASGSRGGLISDSDRQILEALGTEVAPTAARNAEREKFYFYMNLMKPAEQVRFSYPEQDLDGAVCRESYFMKEARRCLDIKGCRRSGRTEGIYTKGELKALLAASINADMDRAALYMKALKAVGESAEDLISKAEDEERLSPEAAQILFGSRFIESPTELERFAACPYEHFLGYGLRLQERKDFDLQMSDIGSLLHKVLELYSRRLEEKRLTFRSVDDVTSKAILDSAMKDAGDDVMMGRISLLSADSARGAHMIERLGRYASRSVDTLRFQAGKGSFDGIYFEKKFNDFGLKGTIDRCDEARTPSGIFIDVIDYKTGNRDFNPDRIYHGLDIQLPVYLNAAMKMREALGEETVKPAGLFYYHVDDPIVEGSRASADDELDQAVRRELRLRGVVNADEEAIRAFDRDVMETRRSAVVPVSFKSNGEPDSYAKLYTEEEMRGMLGHTIRLTDELRGRIKSGEVAKSPYMMDKRAECEYCAYKEICDGGHKRNLKKQVFPEAWKTWNSQKNSKDS